MIGTTAAPALRKPSPPSMWPLSLPAQAARWALQLPMFAALRLLAQVEITGREWLDDIEPPAVLVANHSSHLDTPAILWALPQHWRRRLAVAAARDYFFDSRMLGWVVALLVNAFPISRDWWLRRALSQCLWLRDHGWAILVFPEGTRSTSGDMMPFKRGIGLLSGELRLPVIPVSTHGTHAMLPKGRWLPRQGTIHVRFGRPIMLEDGQSSAAAAKAMEAAVRALQRMHEA